MDRDHTQAKAERPYVSTGHLPPAALIGELVTTAHERFKNNAEGQNSQIGPGLGPIDPVRYLRGGYKRCRSCGRRYRP